MSFIAVSDVDAAKASALRNGGKVLMQPRNVPNRGREAVFTDPQGAVFGVLASTSGDPPDVPTREAAIALVKAKARVIRRRALTTVFQARQGHPGGDMSVTDILATL